MTSKMHYNDVRGLSKLQRFSPDFMLLVTAVCRTQLRSLIIYIKLLLIYIMLTRVGKQLGSF